MPEYSDLMTLMFDRISFERDGLIVLINPQSYSSFAYVAEIL